MGSTAVTFCTLKKSLKPQCLYNNYNDISISNNNNNNDNDNCNTSILIVIIILSAFYLRNKLVLVFREQKYRPQSC